MANPTASLARRFRWPLVAQVLQVEQGADREAIYCPLCSKQGLVAYPDATLGADWLHCLCCDFAGDPIELASAVWQLDIPNTIQRLQQSGVGAEIHVLRHQPG